MNNKAVDVNGEDPASKKLDLSKKHTLYKIYSIRKPNGKKRIIHAPCDALKLEQKSLARKLELEYEAPPSCFGFVKGRSAADAVKEHVGKDWVVTIDLKDFFPSISRRHLDFLDSYGAEIATLNGKLVQGSPCSPIISNIVLKDVDDFLHTWYMSCDKTYTRYADDITLSGMGKPSWEDVRFIGAILRGKGFRVNDRKIKFMFKNQEQRVLGITVNDKVSVNHKYRKNLREKIRRSQMTEVELGKLAYIKSINEEQYNKLLL